VTGLTLIGQRDRAVYARTRGALVGVGWHIETDSTGPVIRLFRHWQGEPFDSSLALVDSQIVYREGSSGNTVIEMGGRHPRSFFFDNVYLKNAAKVHTVNLPEAPNGWVRAERLAVHAQPEPVDVLGETREVAEPVFVDGRRVGDGLFQAEPGEEPPADLQSRHCWPDHFPTFEMPGAANVKRYGAVGDGKTDDTAAIQRAIDASEIVFLPKGHYVISDTLHLRPDTKLIGVHHSFTQIRARSSRERRFGGNTRPDEVGVPMIRTADDPDAETYLGFLAVRMTFPLAQHDPSTIGHYALEWRCGCRSMTRAIDITPHRSAGYYPAWVARDHYGLDLRPDPNYPEDSMPAGKPVFCTKWPLVHVAGNGGGRWFNNWLHGGHMFREDCRIFLVEGTRQPLSFYHLHMQQQASAYHAEFHNAHNVSIYGVKCELKGGVAKFVDCDNVRMIGHGGLGTPDAGHGYTHLYLFRNTPNFLIACIGDDVNLGKSRWIGGDYYRWVNATLGTFHPFTEVTPDGESVEMDPFLRPILYLRGNPGHVPCSAD
ncbi:MAG: glycosyl hydrolase family 28-related protein, partial [Candidatus Brocadiaceae bacterium]